MLLVLKFYKFTNLTSKNMSNLKILINFDKNGPNRIEKAIIN